MIILINNKFSAILWKKHLEISKVSNDTEISKKVLSNLYHKRNKDISFDILDKLCQYLNCEIEDIIEYQKM